jgi:tetratricopeptide (TPR) repeat protein
VIEGLGPYRRAVSGASPEAQRWFDQGLNLLFAFNHDEAIRDFEQAAALSPGCAMAYWGIAYASGPNINAPKVSPTKNAKALVAAQQALRFGGTATPVEQELIVAIGHRYADPPPADRGALDAAFAASMRVVARDFPGDADVASWTAEAEMDLHPWDLYAPDGKPLAWSPEILAAVRAALAIDPRHPMANHLLIHAVEGSAHPEDADAAAEILRTLQPGLGHMVHMPSHIDVRTGRWDQAIEANRRAIAADDAYQKLSPDQATYSLYMAHNHQMLAYAAMMSGRSAEALAAATAMLEQIPAAVRHDEAESVDGCYAMPLEVLMRFGRWDELLAVPDFGEELPASRALRHAARAIALAAKHQHAEAKEEERLFFEGRARVPDSESLGMNPMAKILDVAEHLARGEVLLQAGSIEPGLAELRLAVAAEDQLRYDEPPDWLQPTRHALGAALSRWRHHAEAIAVFREDLRRTPGNGWSLYGLARELRSGGHAVEAAKLEAQFKTVWAKADTPIKSACMCLSGV